MAASSVRPARWASASKASDDGSPPAWLAKAMSTDDGSRPFASETCVQVVDGFGQALGRVEGDRAGGLGEAGRSGERAPAVAAVGDPLTGPPAVAADPDGRMGSAHRSRVGRDAAGVEVAALEGHVVAGPDRLQHVERLVEQLVALGVVDAERRELSLQVAGADGQREAAAGQHVERGGCLGDHERVAIRQHDDVRDQPQRGGVGGREAEGDERVEGVVAATVEPALRGRGVVGEPEAVEPRRLRGRGHGCDPGARHQIRVVRVRDERVGDGEPHASIPSRPASANSWWSRNASCVVERSVRSSPRRAPPHRVVGDPAVGAQRLAVDLAGGRDGDLVHDPHEAGGPLRAEVGLLGEERGERGRVEGCLGVELEGGHHLVAGAWVGHGVDDHARGNRESARGSARRARRRSSRRRRAASRRCVRRSRRCRRRPGSRGRRSSTTRSVPARRWPRGWRSSPRTRTARHVRRSRRSPPRR